MRCPIRSRAPLLLLLAVFMLALFLGGAKVIAANFTIEPYGGYEFGYQVQGTTAYSESGPELGIRAGLDFDGLLLGADYVMGDLAIANPGNSYTSRTTDLGAYLGYSFSMVRLWGTYWFQSSGTSNNSSYSGSGGYTVGLAVKVFDMVSLIIEKNLRTYTKQGNNELNPDTRVDDTMVGLSLPFSF